MTNWMDPLLLESQAVIFNKIVIAFLGLLAWEVVVMLWFDLEIVTRQRAFKWPMVLYWTSKYSMLLANIGVTIAENVTTEVNCEALYVFNQLMGNFAIGTASTLLMLRTIAVWSRNRFVMYPLIVLSLGQWAILLHSVVTVSATWSDAGQACLIKSSPMINLQILYLYTMGFDLFVLIITSIGLYRLPGRQTSGNQLWSLLFRDGLVFFLVAFSSNLVAVIFVLADFNPVMNVIASVPAATITSIVSCRLFVRLSTYNDAPANTMIASGGRTGVKALNHTVRKPGGDAFAVASQGSQVNSTGVHVQMDTFVSHARGPNFSTVNFDDRRDVESQHEKGSLPYTGDNASSEDFPDEKHNMKSFMPK